jgi:hypothetical protein
MTHHQMFDKHNTMSATSGPRIAYPSGARGFTLVFMEFVFTFLIVFYRLFVVSDYPFRIFKPFLI